ncbi:MAG: haloacid dehalogenase-like hydrolase [Solobacterium sp.]|nr:haloacid dehalogenase-like hydrolase [Solobacterium sp.]
MKKVAVLYDFDKTLCTKDMQEYSLIPSLGYEEPGSFWREVSQLSASQQMDSISAYLYWLQKKYSDHGRELHRSDFQGVGANIDLYEGVEEWFERINRYGRDLGLEVEHYVISSGMSEIIEDTRIADRFRRIYACRYYYDEKGTARWPALIVNYTTKTQYIFRINKQVLDVSNDDDLNTWVDPKERPIPFSRMIYIGDGLTDVPCMRLVKEYGGKSFAVFNPASIKAYKTASRLIHEGRVNFMCEADYREGKDMDVTMKRVLEHMSADAHLEDLDGIIK